MGRAGNERKRKEKIHVSVDAEVVRWAEANSGLGKRFSSLSHAVEFALYRLREQLEEE